MVNSNRHSPNPKNIPLFPKTPDPTIDLHLGKTCKHIVDSKSEHRHSRNAKGISILCDHHLRVTVVRGDKANCDTEQTSNSYGIHFSCKMHILTASPPSVPGHTRTPSLTSVTSARPGPLTTPGKTTINPIEANWGAKPKQCGCTLWVTPLILKQTHVFSRRVYALPSGSVSTFPP